MATVAQERSRATQAADGFRTGVARVSAAVGASALAGGLLLLSQPTVNVWPLTWIALVPLMWAVVSAPTHRRGFLYGFVTGVVLSAGGFPWLVDAFRAYWGISLTLAVPVFAGFCAWQAVLFGAFGVAIRIFRRRTGFPFAFIAPVTLVALEFVMPLAVPWYLAVLQAWVLPIIQIAEITGPLGVTFCFTMVNGALYDAWLAHTERRPMPRRTLAVTATAMGLVVTFGLVRMAQIDARWAEAPKLKLGVVQTNIRADEKPQVDPARRLSIAEANRLHQENIRKVVAGTIKLRIERPDLVIWPESSYPKIVPHIEEPSQTQMPSLYAHFREALMFGAVSQDAQDRWFNSAFLLLPDGRVTGRYDKNVLFLLGERNPISEALPFVRSLFPEGGDPFEPGVEVTTFQLPDPRARNGHWRLGPLICLEDILRGQASRVGRLRPHALVSLGNDAWFGASGGPWGHLALSVFRSVEQRTALVRASQTGISAFIDATGRLRKHLPPTEPKRGGRLAVDTLADEVAMLEAGQTLYATLGSLWGRGDLLGWLTLGLLGGVLLAAAWTHNLEHPVRRPGLKTEKQWRGGRLLPLAPLDNQRVPTGEDHS